MPSQKYLADAAQPLPALTRETKPDDVLAGRKQRCISGEELQTNLRHRVRAGSR